MAQWHSSVLRICSCLWAINSNYLHRRDELDLHAKLFRRADKTHSHLCSYRCVKARVRWSLINAHTPPTAFYCSPVNLQLNYTKPGLPTFSRLILLKFSHTWLNNSGVFLIDGACMLADCYSVGVVRLRLLFCRRKGIIQPGSDWLWIFAGEGKFDRDKFMPKACSILHFHCVISADPQDLWPRAL
jgi:hypothetical protein